MEDLDLSLDDFLARVNSDLVGKYINIASRCAGFITKRFDGKLASGLIDKWLPELLEDAIHAETSGKKIGLNDLPDKSINFTIDMNLVQLLPMMQKSAAELADLYEQRDFSKAIRQIMELADLCNIYVDRFAPWALAKNFEANKEHIHVGCSIALNAFRLLALYLKPVLPKLAENVESFLNIPPLKWKDSQSLLPNGHTINPYQHLITRVDQKQIDAMIEANKETLAPVADTHSPARHGEAQQHTPSPLQGEGVKVGAIAPLITIDDFSKIDLRVARIVNAEHVEGAEKLLKLTLDIGEEKPRTVFAGIKSVYDPEKPHDGDGCQPRTAQNEIWHV